MVPWPWRNVKSGWPPASCPYTPSVFSMLARLVERAGRFAGGSITAFYTVLMQGDDQQDPLVDALRSLVDGHIVLDRRLASQNHYPPISLLDSLSRLMPSVASGEHLTRSHQLRALLSAYAKSEDLIRIGAYSKGADPVLDDAIAVLPELQAFLRQAPEERAPFADTVARLNSFSC
jgi:flagellum-specific ATP synthase